MKVQLLYQNKSITGEAATWLGYQKKLLWVDIENKTLFEYSPEKHSCKKHIFENMVSTIIPCKENNNDVILALENKLVQYNLSTKEQVKLCDIPTQDGSLRTNDGKASPEGRIWLGLMHFSDQNKTGFLYRIEHDLSLVKVLNNQCIPNGMVWSKDGETLFYVDSGKSCITKYAYNKHTGNISSPQVVITVSSQYGVPDGMTIDVDGMLWVAHWGGAAVCVWNPNTGELINKIELPVPNVASCTFGGNEMNELYITTACAGLSEEELDKYPLSGSLFMVKTNTKGAMNHYPF